MFGNNVSLLVALSVTMAKTLFCTPISSIIRTSTFARFTPVCEMSLISAKSTVHSCIVQLLIQCAVTPKKAFILKDVQQSIVSDNLDSMMSNCRLTSEYSASNSFCTKQVIVSAEGI